MHFYLESLPEEEEHLKVNFSGSGIKFLMVNGQVLEPKDIMYRQHLIWIPRSLVRERAKNTIEVIF